MLGLTTTLFVLLILCVFIACIFEFVNGFHDTANAVATVIYTNTLKPMHAVVWSGFCNFCGVLAGGITVAMGIVNLLPTEMITDQNIYQSISMILALLITAIAWNLGTWYFGIPCSSSHTLIGSILGVGITYSLVHTEKNASVNWSKAGDIGLSLLISPFFGFLATILLMFLMKIWIKDKKIFKEPSKNVKPPFWVRIVLFLTCTGVSFAHGSNDGQKGVGLIMLILISIVPGYFALNSNLDIQSLNHNIDTIQNLIKYDESISSEKKVVWAEIKEGYNSITEISKSNNISVNDKLSIRIKLIKTNKKLDGVLKNSKEYGLSIFQKKEASLTLGNIRNHTDYAPYWVLILISISLGVGTMIGWKRIVLTIGEKIGKEHLTYAQGASAELVAASTIGISTYLGLPVSTTHVLSSGIAGSMVASKGVSNLNKNSIKNIATAWVLTFPVCVTTSGFLFWILNMILAH